MTSEFKCGTRFLGILGSHGEAVNAMLWGLMSSGVELSVGVMREVLKRFGTSQDLSAMSHECYGI